MGFFNFFKKTPAATQGEQKQNENSHITTAQLKQYTCARCKKGITDEESQWIGNHRFCSDCVAPLEASSISKHLKETRDMFICQNCGEELASKYMHKNKICVKCALRMDRQNENSHIATAKLKPYIIEYRLHIVRVIEDYNQMRQRDFVAVDIKKHQFYRVFELIGNWGESRYRVVPIEEDKLNQLLDLSKYIWLKDVNDESSLATSLQYFPVVEITKGQLLGPQK